MLAQGQTPEAYVVKSTDEKTLTFRYDAKKNAQTGTVYAIDPSAEVPVWVGTYSEPSLVEKVVFDVSFDQYRPTSTRGWFAYFKYLQQIKGIEYLHTEKVTDMSNMFDHCQSLRFLDLANFKTTKVSDLSEMFDGCANLKVIYASPAWNQGANGTDMFKGCVALKGAVAYDAAKVGGEMANPETGYFVRKSPNGLNSVTDEGAAPTAIYNLQGVRLHTVWPHLPAGVYIVNGRKVVK